MAHDIGGGDWRDLPQGDIDAAMKRAASIRAGRESYDAHYDQLARFMLPRLGLRLSNGSQRLKRGGEVNNRLMDTYGIYLMNTLANGMTSGMSSATMPWFKIEVEGHEAAPKIVKVWCAHVEEVLYRFFAKTNFYAAQKDSYYNLGLFGTATTVMVHSFQRLGVSHTVPTGDYWIALDEDLVANTLLRRVDMTTIQMVQKFGKDRLPETVRSAYDRGDYHSEHCCWHLIEPNGDRSWGRLDNMNMPFRSYYWMEGQKKFLSVSGFEERPFWAPRWDILGTDVYGRSPAMDALPSSRQLQLEKLRKAEAMDYGLKPALVGPTALNNTNASLLPRSITTMSNVDKDAFGPIWEVKPEMVGQIRESIADVKQEMAAVTFADLFMAITNMPGVQPRNIEEIARRNEEKLTQLGPVIDRNQNEQLRVAIDRAFGLCNRAGLIDPPPEEVQGEDMRIVFVGLLAQMQQAIGVGPLERAFNFVAAQAAVQPSALDKWDSDAAIDEYVQRVGAPPKVIRDTAEVERLRAGRQQSEQLAQIAAMAPAAKDGAQAAKLASEFATQPGVGIQGPAALSGLI